jgi:hypothetical protein
MNSDYQAEGSPSAKIFENSFELMKASEFCIRFGYSMKTIYEWNYRPKKHNIPDNLVVKFRGKLFIRTDILKSLILR